MLGFPAHGHVCLFGLDGAVTRTAKVREATWEEMCEACLHERATREGTAFVPFDAIGDYDGYVGGRPREDGVHGWGNGRNGPALRRIRDKGAEPYEGSVRFVHAVRQARLRCAVVASSADGRDVARGRRLRGRPAPGACPQAARGLGTDPTWVAVFEDAVAGDLAELLEDR
ncbi:hypothetical protein SRB17_25890 [Streptomyces sp. RB17]|uniref:hypothetical protein n=1 Tax=Streptomyces sp. RB17 TaxID=2585197 RepID=UPI001294D26A|nr:hypothetical protein [Streptomyces sp. RB17]MQY34619.1 hypothetical protein [Streptomyces sp. RB17]